MDKKKTNVEIDVKRLLLSVVKRLWLILLVGILAAGITFGCVKTLVAPEYAAEVRMYVNNTYGSGTVGFSSSQMMAAQSLASTYMVILDSYDVLEEVAEAAKTEYKTTKKYSVGELRGMISTESLAETEVFRVVVVSTEEKDAVAIANAVKDVLPKRVNEIVNGITADDSKKTDTTENPEEAGATEEKSNVAPPLVALQKAEKRGKIAPNESRYAMLAFLAGALITAVIAVARDLMDTSINSEEYLTFAYEDIPLLAVIPDAENPKSGSGYKGYYEAKSKKTPAPKNAPPAPRNVPPAQKKGEAK